LLRLALSHLSYINETNEGQSWERLEYLGDAVLELVLSEALYALYPEEDEGFLTQRRSSLVNQTALALKARELKVGERLFIGKGEEKNAGRNKESILSDCMEALFGAYFLEKGYLRTKNMILALFKQELTVSFITQLDYKSLLQEFSQKNTPYLPVYKVVEERGPSHARFFTVRVSLKSYHSARGFGTSKKIAEQNAARSFTEKNGLMDELGHQV
jgi:ribonuclease-3